MGRARNGTGLAGSEMYSSYASPALGAEVFNFSPAVKYTGVDRIVQPLAHPVGQSGKRRHMFVPVSYAFTLATPLFGAPSFKYSARNGRRISCLKYNPVSVPNLKAPSELASSIC